MKKYWFSIYIFIELGNLSIFFQFQAQNISHLLDKLLLLGALNFITSIHDHLTYIGDSLRTQVLLNITSGFFVYHSDKTLILLILFWIWVRSRSRVLMVFWGLIILNSTSSRRGFFIFIVLTICNTSCRIRASNLDFITHSSSLITIIP